jgi:predicted nucleotidyltransferase
MRMEAKGIAAIRITIPTDEISDFCQHWKATELALFGSALRHDFSPGSDVDVLMSFASEANWSLFDLIRMERKLEGILGREVDLVERTAVDQSENYIRRRNILKKIKVIYVAR